ncbi:MAG: hypothetical protein ACI9AV_001042, partial [Sediminicola sp.]
QTENDPKNNSPGFAKLAPALGYAKIHSFELKIYP